jgi:hypothetical protein
MRLRISVEQQQRRPATTRHQVDCRAGGLDLPLLEAGKEVGHRRLRFSRYSSRRLCPGQCFLCGNAVSESRLPPRLFGDKLEVLSRNPTVMLMQSGR